MQIIFMILFIITSVIHLIGEFKKNLTIRYFTKPLLMPFLGLSYIIGNPAVNYLIVAGLIGGFLGDVLLMIPDPKNKGIFFMFGLISFLLGHLFYIIALILLAGNFSQFPLWGLILILPFVLYGIITYSKLMPHIKQNAPEMKLPVTVYLLVILSMGISTMFPLGNISTHGFLLLLAGAISFIISDSILAFDKFGPKIKNARIYTMITYLAAQFLIVVGFTIAV